MSTEDRVETAAQEYPTAYPKLFWVGMAIGWAVIAFGIRGLLINADSPMPTEPAKWATLFVKAGILNDLVVLPLVFLIGHLIGRTVPERVRAPVQGGLICAAIVTAFAYPFVRGFGLNGGNPTILPRNYGRGLALVLAAIVIGTSVLAVLSWRRSSPARPVAAPTVLRPNDRPGPPNQARDQGPPVIELRPGRGRGGNASGSSRDAGPWGRARRR